MGFFVFFSPLGPVVDDVKSRLCLHWVQCCSVLHVWPSDELCVAPLPSTSAPPLLFSNLVCTFRYCSNCGRSYTLKFVYILICIQYVSVYGCSGASFHTYTNRYLFLFCMIETKPGASPLSMSDQVGCSRNIAVLTKLLSLWLMHCECVIRNAYYIHFIGYVYSLPNMH